MMSIIIMMSMFFFIVNILSKMILQWYMQSLMFIIYFYILVSFPLNNNHWVWIYYNLGMDCYSWGLVLLSIWIIMLMMMVSNKIFFMKSKILYMMNINFMLIILIMCFYSLNMMMFYIYFESSLIPVFMLILGWGYQVERIQAGFYMMLYTLFGSMPLFLVILYFYEIDFTLMMNLMFLKNLNFLIYYGVMIAFLIKMPMFLMHLWLPKAHVEAPIMGSMILAGVMLKLGSYGMMRALMMMVNLCKFFNKFLLIFSLMGGIYMSLISLNQIDMKLLVAYSSVVHMSILLSGMMTLFNWGITGGYLMMISHGLCSSGLFCLVNISYERVLSRNLFINKGLINYYPSLSLLWFLLCSSNLSFPPSLNLFSELMLFNSLIMWNKLVMLILMFISFFSALYTLYLFTFSQHGKFNFLMLKIYLINVKEYFLLLLHWIPLNLMFLMMILFI